MPEATDKSKTTTAKFDDNRQVDSAPLSTGAIAAIAAVGGCLVLTALIVLIVFLVRRRRRESVPYDSTLKRVSAVNADDPPATFATIVPPDMQVYGSAPPITGASFGEYGSAPPQMLAPGEYDIAPPEIMTDNENSDEL